MTTTRALRRYSIQYADPIRVGAGAVVSVGRRDEEYRHWLWCIAADGRAGWVPETILDSTAPGSATVLEAYSAVELPLEEGEEVQVLRQFDGFALGRSSGGSTGWFPLTFVEAIEPPIAYDSLFRAFDSPLMQQIRSEAYGEDIGQHSWVTADDLRDDIGRLRLAPASRLLDLGCGPCGPLTFAIANTGCMGTGLELSVEAIAAGEARAQRQGVTGRFAAHAADLDAPLPLAAHVFDAAMSLDVVLHLRDRGSFFREVARVLSPRGRFLMTDAGVLTGEVSDDEKRHRSIHGPIQFVGPDRNEALLKEAGFRVIETQDRTDSILRNAGGRLAAIRAHRAELEAALGADHFRNQEIYLETVLELARRHALSRFMYLAEAK